MSPSRTLAVIVPVYNEAALVERAIGSLRDCPAPAGIERLIIAVDDGSSDGTGGILDRLDAEHEELVVVHLKPNRGKGAAIRAGMERAGRVGERGADFVLIHDADLEYDPADHARVLGPLLDGRADAVLGTRFLGQTHRVLYYWHSIANRAITTLCNMVTNLNLTDIECCTKAFTREVAERLGTKEDRFGIEPEMVARLARMRVDGKPLRIFEVPVSYAGRTYAEGKKIRARDGVRAAWCIIRYGLFG
ncbi:MAG: glycosyltransferase family 2 protein [Phycisphaerales bacterium]